MPRDFYTRSDVLEVARDLLGRSWSCQIEPFARGRIIVKLKPIAEPKTSLTCYSGRRTNRTETMFGIGGTAYVYFVLHVQQSTWSRMSRTCRMPILVRAGVERRRDWMSCALPPAPWTVRI